jgi:Protein phosphatase 2C
LKLVGAVTQGSGATNEDGYGYLGMPEDVTAAWILDGVTGINGRNYLPAGTDAAWLVERADKHLRLLADLEISLGEIISLLVSNVIEDWEGVARGLELPENYDPPAACLVLAKRYGDAWQVARLGDTVVLGRAKAGRLTTLAASSNNDFERWLTGEAAKRRDADVLDIKSLLAEFKPQLAQARQMRNRAGGYGILEANPAAAEYAEYLDFEDPDELLICTDGYYRAVDYYHLHDDETLLAASLKPEGVEQVLGNIRRIEAADATCVKYPRFKPADDVTAVALLGSKPDK